MYKEYCDSCGKEHNTRQIQVFIATSVIDRPNKSWPGNNVFSIDLCKGCFPSISDSILKNFGKSFKDVHL